MSLLLSAQSLSKTFGGVKSLFDDLSLSISSGDRIGLVGLNGSGKSTLLKVLIGMEKPDSGIISARRDLKIGYVPQTCEFSEGSPKEILIHAIEEDLPLYEKERLAEVQLSLMGFTGEEPSAALLSGGWKKRLKVAEQLISNPQLLLLDEPTNHLDLEGILWLEKFLKKQAPTYLVISHDRYFLQHVTNKIIEIDKLYPQGVFVSDGTYQEFLSRKEDFLQGQLEQERSLAGKARRETAWLRAGVKARTTKAKSRINAAEEILEEYKNTKHRNVQKKAGIDFVATERETRKLLVAKNLSKTLGNKPLFSHLDFTLSPGTRMGLMGPNGSGKTTLLKMLMEEVFPDQGTIKRADGLKVVYFDQHRAQLPLHLTLKEALSPSGDFVSFHGQKIHVNGWCQRFLFSPDLLEMPLEKLSGGERARITIANLMLKPADILLLDEPTNDLDIPTLETLEESLLEFPGAIVLITHDRCMMDRICNVVLGFGDPSHCTLFPDYAQWEAFSQKNSKEKEKKQQPASATPVSKDLKLSYKEKKELDSMEDNILKLEEEVRALNQLLGDPSISENPQKLHEVCSAIGIAETKIEQLYLRWEELEKRKN